MKIGSKGWPYIVGFAGAAALAYLWLAPRLIKPGIGYNPSFHIPGLPAGPHHAGHMAHSRAAMAPMMGGIHRNKNIVGESGGTIPVGGGPAGVTGGGGDYMFPSGMIGKPGGYGVSGGYLGEAFGSSRLAIA